MKLREIDITAFGLFTDYRIEDLSPGLNIFFGCNESGKTTIFEFLFRMFYEFRLHSRRKDYNPYTPLKGGSVAGSLLLNDTGGRQLRLQKRLSGTKESFNLRLSDGSTGSEDEWKDILHKVTPEVYRDVFAITLDELQSLRDDSMNRLYGAGLGLKDVSLTEVLKDLDKRADEFYRSSRAKRLITEYNRRYRDIHREIRELSERQKEYDQTVREKDELEREIRSGEEEIDRIEKEKRHFETLSGMHEVWIRKREAEKRIADLPEITDFPENGVLRFEQKQERLTEIRDRIVRENSRREKAESDLRFTRGKISSFFPEIENASDENLTEEINRGLNILDKIHSGLSELQQKQGATEKARDKKDSLHEKMMLSIQALEQKKGPSIPLFLKASPVFILILGIVFLVMGKFLPGIITLICSLALIYLSWKQVRKESAKDRSENAFTLQEQEIRKLNREIEDAASEMEEIRKDIASESGKMDLPESVNLNDVKRYREELIAARSDMKNMIREQAAAEETLQNLREEEKVIKDSIKEMLKSGAAEDEDEFRKNARIFIERSEAIGELEDAERDIRNLAGKEADDLLHELDSLTPGEIETGIHKLNSELDEKKETINRFRTRMGELTESLKQLEVDRIPELRQKEEEIISKINSAAGEWSVYRLAQYLLESAREKYEKERQPHILKLSAEIFRKMTCGGYSRIALPSESRDIVVFDESENPVDVKFLSRGTLEQLYLSLRLGLIRSFAENGVVLPVVMDDVLVNFDPERASKAAEALLDLGETHQVIFLTCHPRSLEQFKSLDNDVRIHHIKNV